MPDLKGIDLASWQGEPNQWAKDSEAQGIQWAAVKFSEYSPVGGAYVNPMAKADWDYLWERKLGRVAYLFAHPSVSVANQVALFKSMTDKLGLIDTDGICVDLEVTDGMSPAAVASFARELMAELAGLYGRRPILYTFINFAETGNCAGLENYFLWIASLTTAGIPTVPPPWRDWFAQQYGQNGNIDRDVAHFSSLAAMQAAMGKPQFHTIVAVHVTAGMDGLVNLSHILQCPISDMLALTLNGSANSRFTPELADYLDWGDFQRVIPKGITIRFHEVVRA